MFPNFRLKKNESGEINIQEFLDFVNVKKYISPPIQPVNLDVRIKQDRK